MIFHYLIRIFTIDWHSVRRRRRPIAAFPRPKSMVSIAQPKEKPTIA